MEKYLLYGSGGHAKVVMECLESESKVVDGYFDDDPQKEEFQGVKVWGTYDSGKFPDGKVIITIGNNAIRKKISEKIAHAFGKTIYATNIISSSAEVGVGSMVLQGAIINSGATIGKHVIVNTAAVVEHDSVIEDFVHVGPGAVVCGHATIGEGTLLGANAVVGPLVKVGKWCQISAGSAVTEEIPDYSLVMGVPGKVVKRLQ